MAAAREKEASAASSSAAGVAAAEVSAGGVSPAEEAEAGGVSPAEEAAVEGAPPSSSQKRRKRRQAQEWKCQVYGEEVAGYVPDTGRPSQTVARKERKHRTDVRALSAVVQFTAHPVIIACPG